MLLVIHGFVREALGTWRMVSGPLIRMNFRTAFTITLAFDYIGMRVAVFGRVVLNITCTLPRACTFLQSTYCIRYKTSERTERIVQQKPVETRSQNAYYSGTHFFTLLLCQIPSLINCLTKNIFIGWWIFLGQGLLNDALHCCKFQKVRKLEVVGSWKLSHE